MNKEQMSGNVQQLKGKIKETWGRLSDDDVALYEGKQDQFFGRLRKEYGLTKEEAEAQMGDIERAYKADHAA